MKNSKLREISEVLYGLNKSEWQSLKNIVDEAFLKETAKVELGSQDEIFKLLVSKL